MDPLVKYIYMHGITHMLILLIPLSLQVAADWRLVRGMQCFLKEKPVELIASSGGFVQLQLQLGAFLQLGFFCVCVFLMWCVPFKEHILWPNASWFRKKNTKLLMPKSYKYESLTSNAFQTQGCICLKCFICRNTAYIRYCNMKYYYTVDCMLKFKMGFVVTLNSIKYLWQKK